MTKLKNTLNYGLKKPEGSDVVNIEDLNFNADIIDTKLKETESHLAENATIKHKAKEIGLEDTSNNFTNKNVEGAMTELFTNVSNGKQLVGTAITDVDNSVVIPTDPSFGDLASVIGSISTGKKWASGVVANISRPVKVTGLDFTPSIIIAKQDNHDNGNYGNSAGLTIIVKENIISTNIIKVALDSSGLFNANDSNNCSIQSDGFTLYGQYTTGADMHWIAIE